MSSNADGELEAFGLVDYGPGGGSGVARMSAVVALEEELPLVAEYFTQRHCVRGKLPQSWLKWIRSEEERVVGEEKLVKGEEGGSAGSKGAGAAGERLTHSRSGERECGECQGQGENTTRMWLGCAPELATSCSATLGTGQCQ